MSKTTELIARVKSYPRDTMQWDEPGLAGDVIAELVEALESAQPVLQPTREALRKAIETTEVWRVLGFNIEPVLDAILAASSSTVEGEVEQTAKAHRCEFYPYRDAMECVCGNRKVTP